MALAFSLVPIAAHTKEIFMRSRANANNHSNQMNPNNSAYWSARGAPQPAAPAPSPTPVQAPPSPPAAAPQPSVGPSTNTK